LVVTIDGLIVFCYPTLNTNLVLHRSYNTRRKAMLKQNNGFTLIELLTVVVIIGVLVIGVLGIGVIGRGNFWYSDDGVLREIKADHPGVIEVLKTKRNVFAKSVITVKENGVNHDYCLDTDVFWNYEFSECQK
jgi:prepilin-type N-terminal cleavage/methylation domain-containing protein